MLQDMDNMFPLVMLTLMAYAAGLGRVFPKIRSRKYALATNDIY